MSDKQTDPDQGKGISHTEIVPVTKQIVIASAGSWFNRLKARINVTEVLDDTKKIDPKVPNYKITKEEWGATLGPIYNRVVEHFHDHISKRDDTYAIAVGYKNMRSVHGTHQTPSLHSLMQAFSAATKPGYIDGFRTLDLIDGTTRENPHGKLLQKFKDVWDNEDSILISQTQLKALANIAKGAADYAFKEMKSSQGYSDETKEFYQNAIKNNPKISY